MAGPRAGGSPARRGTVVSREPIHEQILPHIRRDIVEGRWAPGERLPEPVLCAEFGISRTPLRDALKLLEAEGLVELQPHVGAVVTDPGIPDVAEKMELLAALEQLAVAKVAAQQPPAAIAAIRRLHAQMQKAAHAGDAATYYRLNDEFHRVIVLGAGNKTLAEMHERLLWHVYRARHRANEHERIGVGETGHHDRIVRHVLAGESEAAARVIGEHLGEVSTVILARHGG
jgi:DNA-binding GntR family transcriptional regulator